MFKENQTSTIEEEGNSDNVLPDLQMNDTIGDDQPSSVVSSEADSEGTILLEQSFPHEQYTPIPDVVPSEQLISERHRDYLPEHAGDWRNHSSGSRGTVLPWGANKDRSVHPSFEMDLRPGEFVMRMLFAEFTVQAERKMEAVMAESFEKPLNKTLQHGEDAQLDQILCAFGTVAEHCLPSLLRALFGWLQRQMQDSLQLSEQSKKPHQDQKNKSIIYMVSGSGMGTETIERSHDELLAERRDLAVEFLFCLALIEVLKQLPFHPGHEDLVQYIENLAFKRFNYKEGLQSNPNAANIHIIADLYAEVIGVLAQSRFSSVKKRFTAELKELKGREPSPHNTQSIISLLMGMKFFRVKMVPIEEFEASFQFLQECAQYFLEVKDKDIKHALAGLFVEILVPVAATVKNEVNVPCLKNFVDMLYSQTLDASTKSKHRLALFPLVTCLLCVSQKMFFLANWHYFLAMCLSHLKNRDPKMCRVALESLYRLLWVYMIRIKCESNSATQSRLQSIVNSLFPKGSKGVVPRDTPLNIFVKIIQFIAQERLDFAMREIVFDLLMVGRQIKIILTPERMSIGLRAFLVVADSLQQKEGEPPMPRTSGTLPSGNTLRVKKTFLNKMLTDETARSIGMSAYFPFVRKTLVDILRALDAQYGRPLMMTNTQNITKEQEINTGDRKPRIDLFRTCVAAIPRLIPDGMSYMELVEMLSRLTVHMDEELRGLAFQSLQTLVVDFPEWRQDVLHGFTQFLGREVQDTSPQLLENGLRMLLQLVTSWKNGLPIPTSTVTPPKQEPLSNIIRGIEALGLVMMCQCKTYPRRLAIHILRECKNLLERLQLDKDEPSLMDTADQFVTALAEQCLQILPVTEKQALLAAGQIDLCWLADRTHTVWTTGLQVDELVGKNNTSSNQISIPDPWQIILFGLLEKSRVPAKAPTAIHHAWPILYARINALYGIIDPTPVSDNRASILRSTAPPRKPEKERDMHILTWKYYLTMAYLVVPPVPSPVIRCASPDLSLSSSPDSLSGDRSSLDGKGWNSGGTAPPAALHKLAVPLIRCEINEVRDAAIFAIGHINPDALKDAMEELLLLIREAVDKKQENMRRRRRRDALRLHLGKVLLLIAERKTLANSWFVLEGGSLHSSFVEYVDGVRQCLEVETDKDAPSLREIRLIFAEFVTKVIAGFSLETYPTLLRKDLRRSLFNLFSGWSGVYAKCLGNLVPAPTVSIENDDQLNMAALQAMGALVCCGPCFAPAALAEDGTLYPWLHEMLSSDNERVYKLAREIVVLLLECNPDIGPLLDWTIDKCYTGTPRVADGCFMALATIFSTKDYPCDHYTAVINVTLLCTGCPRAPVHETALQLLQLLDKRFFGNIGPFVVADDDSCVAEVKGRGTLDALLCTTYCRSQMYLSRQLAQLHPELTMPMFSEITYRFQTARPDVRQVLLQYLLPWLVNIELVDPNVPPANPLSYIQCNAESNSGRSRREGLGSAEATEMVLNNLFYITAKFSDCHPKEMEELWSTLCACWPNNLKVIIRYLIIISGMAPNELLPFAKRVVLYLARSRPEKLLDEMMNELQIVETLNCLIERTETPPFYRLTSMRKASTHSDTGTSGNGGVQEANGRTTDLAPVEKGTIHTKRHSGEDPAKSCGIKPSESGGTLRGPKGIANCSLTPPPPCEEESPSQNMDHDHDTITLVQCEEVYTALRCTSNTCVAYDKMDVPQPRPLPMPEYGGYFAPLTEYLPDGSQPIAGFHRCNVAVMLLCDVVLDGVELDWSIHVPLMLHIVFLGMDHTRSIVHQHCRQLLLNLLVAVSAHNDHLTVARILLASKSSNLELGLTQPCLPVLAHNFTEPDLVFDSYLQNNNQQLIPGHPASNIDNQPTPETETMPSLPPVIVTEGVEGGEQTAQPLPPSPGPDMPVADVIKSLIHFLAERPENMPLWNYEDITAKVWSVRSCQQLNIMLQHVLKIFRTSLPHALVSERWAQTALQLGLSCPSRHYAGRSLQVFRFIGVAMAGRMVSDILSRLVETVAEQGEDMQGYVTELLLTLEAAVDSLESNFRPLDYTRDIFKSTPNLNNKDAIPGAIANVGHGMIAAGKRSPGGCGGCLSNHTRSTSYSVSYCTRKSNSGTAGPPHIDGKQHEIRNRQPAEASKSIYNNNLCRSRSAQSLKLLGDTANQDDKLTILATLFWLAVSLLESDYEHEFLLGVRLLSRVLKRLPLDRPDARDRVDRLQSQLRWHNYPGVHALLLKGCTHPGTYEPVVTLLAELTPLLELSVLDPSQSVAFPMTVVALLPYMLLHYEDANETCVRAACHIAQVTVEKSKKLENLGTVMNLYSRRTFSKESFQWTKCVVKYLWDTYSHLSLQMLSFLVEVLEKGASSLQLPILSILHCMLYYVEINAVSAQPIISDLLRVVGKFIDGGNNYKEAMKILKLVITRCSTLVVPPHWDTSTSTIIDTMELQSKKELPGRTMDFTFDLSQTPVIGRKYISKSGGSVASTVSSVTISDKSSLLSGNTSVATSSAQEESISSTSNITSIQGAINNKLQAGLSTAETNQIAAAGHAVVVESPRRSASLSPADNLTVSGWKRPWMSQGRVRECLVNLLTTCGQRVGLPKSPSVIFSQSSELLERESSMASSLEEVSGAHGNDLSGGSRAYDVVPTDHFGVFKDFDFLEYESESIEGESSDNFNWGVRRRPLSQDREHDSSINTSLATTERSPPACGLHRSHPLTPRNKQQVVKRTTHDDSSDEDLGSDSPQEESGIVSLLRIDTTLESCSVEPPQSLSLRTRTHSSSSQSSGDQGDVTPIPSMQSVTTPRNLDSWRAGLTMILRQSHPTSMGLVHRLHTVLKDVTMKTVTLCVEGVFLPSSALSVAASQDLTALVEQLNTEELAIIWVGPRIEDYPRLKDAVRYTVLEMNEHLETYFDRLEALELMKSVSGDEIGRCLYKLIFQLLLLLETNNKMITSIYQTAIAAGAHEMSDIVCNVKSSLIACRMEDEMSSEPLIYDDKAIVEMLEEHRWLMAVSAVRERNRNPEIILETGEFPDDDITTLLHIYSKHLMQSHPDMVAITHTITDLSENLKNMMENLYKISVSLQRSDSN